jgi:hypothetical protein
VPRARINQLEGAYQFAESLVVSGLRGQVREQLLQVGAAEPQPAGLAGETEKGLRHSQCHHLGIGDPRRDAHRRSPRHPVRVGLQNVIDLHVQCNVEGVQISVHAGLLLDVWGSTPILDTLALKSRQPLQSHQQQSLELLI